jgi:Cdc6-like AAA superfamily ATPase
MKTKIFLARTEEQDRFRRNLRSLLPSPIEKYLPFLSGFLPQSPQSQDGTSSPYLLLFYGEGGMGKTTLTRRLCELLEQEKEFAGKVDHFFLDWEEERYRTIALQVGHENIEPETLFAILHRNFGKKGWKRDFTDYEKTLETLKEAEKKVENKLNQPADSRLPEKLRKLLIRAGNSY